MLMQVKLLATSPRLTLLQITLLMLIRCGVKFLVSKLMNNDTSGVAAIAISQQYCRKGYHPLNLATPLRILQMVLAAKAYMSLR